MRWEKSVPSNLFQIVWIPVIGVTDKHLTVFGIDSGIDLFVKTRKKKISKLPLLSGSVHLLHHSRCLFLRIWY